MEMILPFHLVYLRLGSNSNNPFQKDKGHWIGFGKLLIIYRECMVIMKGFDKTNSKKTNSKRIVAFSILGGVGITIVFYYLVLPLFISTIINEPLPSNAFSPSFQEFEEMTEEQGLKQQST